MRVTSHKITRFRNLVDVDIEIPDDATLICLIGENGTGKSNILELIAGCASQLGLAPGLQFRRGGPFSDPHDIELTLRVPEGVDLSSQQEQLEAYGALPEWDGTLIYRTSTLP